jgi:hypothetical protein
LNASFDQSAVVHIHQPAIIVPSPHAQHFYAISTPLNTLPPTTLPTMPSVPTQESTLAATVPAWPSPTSSFLYAKSTMTIAPLHTTPHHLPPPHTPKPHQHHSPLPPNSSISLQLCSQLVTIGSTALPSSQRCIPTNHPISAPLGVTSSDLATNLHSATSKPQSSKPSLPPPPTAPTLMTRPHFGGSSYTLTCLSLLLRLGNNATTPQYKKQSATVLMPPSPVTLHTYIIPQCKSVDSPRIPALPHLPATTPRNALPITTTTVQQFCLPALHNLSLLSAPPTSPMSTNCTHNPFHHATIHPHPPHLHTNPTPSLVTSATLSFTLPRTKAPVSTLTQLTSSPPLSKVK